MAVVNIDTSRIEDYRKFLAIKSLPVFRFRGSTAHFPDEYASRVGMAAIGAVDVDYQPSGFLFDYQREIASIAIRKRKFAVFADCGLGKTNIMLEYIVHARRSLPSDKKILIVSPINVVPQTIRECEKFHGHDIEIERIPSGALMRWVESGESQIGITNYEAMNNAEWSDKIGCLVLDESSMLKSHYGSWASKCIELGRGVAWKLCLTGTPAPNDRIEYANHAVFLDRFPNVNAFLATFFINRGQTQNRWELKPHALRPFYSALADWSFFIVNPETYGWKGSGQTVPPINVEIHRVGLTDLQREKAQQASGALFAVKAGGIKERAVMSQLSKGRFGGEAIETLKPKFISDLIATWPSEQTIVWCWYNHEQETMLRALPWAESIDGDTPVEKRLEIISAFQAGKVRCIITKPRILGFGLNLQCCTRQVFSGLVDSYEAYYQAVKRSNRYGSTLPLNVHIPITDLEAPMVESVMAKCRQVKSDSDEQERMFRDALGKH